MGAIGVVLEGGVEERTGAGAGAGVGVGVGAGVGVGEGEGCVCEIVRAQALVRRLLGRGAGLL